MILNSHFQKRKEEGGGQKMTDIMLDIGIFLADPVELAVSARSPTLQAVYSDDQ